MNNIQKIVSVYGFGRFGKLWTEILTEDFQVKVYSRSGVNSDELPQGAHACTELELFDCDALFFCVAISALKGLLKQIAPLCRKDTQFFDTCSVKSYPARWMQQLLPQGCEIIASHPMFGPDSFYQSQQKLTLVMCNVTAHEKTMLFWRDYFTRKKLDVQTMSTDEHDRMVAYSQGITHYIGRILAELQLQPTRIDTLGYTKILEVVEQTCHDSWQLFLDLQNFNPYGGEMRQKLDGAIAKMNRILAGNITPEGDETLD